MTLNRWASPWCWCSMILSWYSDGSSSSSRVSCASVASGFRTWRTCRPLRNKDDVIFASPGNIAGCEITTSFIWERLSIDSDRSARWRFPRRWFPGVTDYKAAVTALCPTSVTNLRFQQTTATIYNSKRHPSLVSISRKVVRVRPCHATKLVSAPLLRWDSIADLAAGRAHGDKLLGRGRMDPHRAVQLRLGDAHLDAHRESLHDLGGMVADHVHADHLGGGENQWRGSVSGGG